MGETALLGKRPTRRIFSAAAARGGGGCAVLRAAALLASPGVVERGSNRRGFPVVALNITCFAHVTSENCGNLGNPIVRVYEFCDSLPGFLDFRHFSGLGPVVNNRAWTCWASPRRK